MKDTTLTLAKRSRDILDGQHQNQRLDRAFDKSVLQVERLGPIIQGMHQDRCRTDFAPAARHP